MKSMSPQPSPALRELEDKLHQNGLHEELKAARALAHDGLPVRDIEGMMNFLLTRDDIVTLLNAAGQPIID